MRFSLLSSILLAAPSLAFPVRLGTTQQKDDTIFSVIKQVGTRIAEFQTQINVLPANSSSISNSSDKLLASLSNVTEAIKSTTQKILSSPQIQFFLESLDVYPEVPKFSNELEAAFESLVAHKQDLIRLKILEPIHKQLETQSTAIEVLVSVLAAKVPLGIKPASDVVLAQLMKVIRNATVAMN